MRPMARIASVSKLLAPPWTASTCSLHVHPSPWARMPLYLNSRLLESAFVPIIIHHSYLVHPLALHGVHSHPMKPALGTVAWVTTNEAIGPKFTARSGKTAQNRWTTGTQSHDGDGLSQEGTQPRDEHMVICLVSFLPPLQQQ